MKRYTYLSLITVALATMVYLVACKASASEKKTTPTNDTIPVKIQLLQQEAVQQAITVSGQFTTDDEALLSFKTGGVISRIYVKEGDAVQKGQLLATLDLTEMNAGVQQAAIGYEKAQRDLNRAENLYRDSVATLEQVQNARSAAALAKQQLDAVKFNQSYSAIRATANGYVLRKLAQEGQVAGPGTPVLQVNGAGSSKWILKVSLSDAAWSVIRKGDKALVQTDTYPGKEIPATVTAKSEGADPVTGTLTAQLTLNDPSLKAIAAGVFGKATIRPQYSINSWSVPYDALLDGDAGTGYVFVTNDGKTVQKVKVQIGTVAEGAVLITGGLEQAKAVIVNGNAYLNEGSSITIVK